MVNQCCSIKFALGARSEVDIPRKVTPLFLAKLTHHS